MADYFQFYIADATQFEIPTVYTEETAKIRLQSDKGILVITTARNMTVPVRVELHSQKPEINLTKVDHAVEGSLQTSGRMVVAGLTDYLPRAAHFSVPAGNLCALVVSTGLGTLSADGLDGQDRYSVHLWPCASQGISVLRQWPG
ncbi:MAG: hypothetical protein ACRDBL_02200 [Rhabdaerophilum sp.]